MKVNNGSESSDVQKVQVFRCSESSGVQGGFAAFRKFRCSGRLRRVQMFRKFRCSESSVYNS